MLLSEYDQSAVKLASAALGRITKVHFDREFISPRPMPSSGVLYHYTTAEGLKGIVENNELWASSAYSLNDLAEIIYGYGVIAEALTAWLTENVRTEGSLSVGVARQLQRWFGEQLFERNVVHPIYLACFCENDNLLSQWRTYGQSGGYSIGFRVPGDVFTNQGFKPEPNVYTSRWVKVEYDRGEQIKKSSALLNTLLGSFDDEKTAQAITAIGEHPFFGYSRISRAIQDILLEEAISFKNAAFNEEREWRVVVRRRELIKQGTDDDGKTPVPVHFRLSKGILVPYVKLIPIDPGKKLPIACVRTGPTLDSINARVTVSMLLDRNGFQVPVHGCDIPVRF